MIKKQLFPILKWGALATYVFFAYHLLLTPLLLEFSLLGILIGWGSLLALLFIIPKQYRKQIAVFSILVIFITKALSQSGAITNFSSIFQYLVIITVIYLVARFYGKLSKTAVITMLAVVLVITFFVPRKEIRLYNHFYTLWESPKLYSGTKIDYFPLFTRDIDGDGQQEIITFGNIEEEEMLYEEQKHKILDPERMPYDIEDQRLFLYVYKWNGTDFERLNNEDIDVDELKQFIPKDYLGFPYYSWSADFTLTPEIQKQNLAEQTGQFGASPFQVMDLNVQTLLKYLEAMDGTYHKKDEFRFETDIESISIANGQLLIEKNGENISMATKATEIVDLIQTKDGIGLLLLSNELELWSLTDNNKLTLTHVLTDAQVSDIMSSTFIVADIQFDGVDEILISAATSRIIRPDADGEWEILFTSPDNSLRFEDFDTIGGEDTPGIIALSKSRIRNNPLRFLTGFSYTEAGLKQDWKLFTSLINVQSVDINGNGENELVATIWRSHKIYVFNKHGLPVNVTLTSIFAFLFFYAIYRRVRYNG